MSDCLDPIGKDKFDTTIQVKLVSSIDEAPLSSLDLRYKCHD